MFALTSAPAAPFPITIDGKEYSLPRFLMPDLTAWAEKIRREQIAEALKEVKDEQDRVRYMLYYAPPKIDVGGLLNRIQTPDGASHVVKHCLVAAGVSADQADKVIAANDPDTLQFLADELSTARAAAPDVDALAGNTTGDGTDPLPQVSGTSGDVPSTGMPSTPDSSTPTASTPQVV